MPAALGGRCKMVKARRQGSTAEQEQGPACSQGECPRPPLWSSQLPRKMRASEQ